MSPQELTVTIVAAILLGILMCMGVGLWWFDHYGAYRIIKLADDSYEIQRQTSWRTWTYVACRASYDAAISLIEARRTACHAPKPKPVIVYTEPKRSWLPGTRRSHDI